MAFTTSFNINIFADDTNLTLANKNYKVLEKVNAKLNKINNWMQSNKLTINHKKTEFILITKKKINKFDIKINGITINRKKFLKIFRNNIDDTLTWKNHVQNLCSKISKGSWAIANIKHFVDSKTLLIIYYSLIYPHLQYCISSWGGAPKATLDPIIKLQKHIIRYITFIKYNTHTQPLFQKLSLLNVNNIYKLKISKYMHKIHLNRNSTLLNNYQLISQAHNYETRQLVHNNYFITRSRTELGKRQMKIKGPTIRLQVPNELKNLSPFLFKKRYKNYLLDTYQN